jgi:GTP cyclohydrolase II
MPAAVIRNPRRSGSLTQWSHRFQSGAGRRQASALASSGRPLAAAPSSSAAHRAQPKRHSWRGAAIFLSQAAVFSRHAAEAGLERVTEARVPLAEAENARLIAFRPRDGGTEHLAILIGAPNPATPVLVRLHSECFTGDLLASLRCDCGDQLRGAIAAIARAGDGVLLYLAQEGRGIGLVNKLRAYRLQDAGFNNPDKGAALERYGICVSERVPHVFPSNGHNERYLRTKATRSGHSL